MCIEMRVSFWVDKKLVTVLLRLSERIIPANPESVAEENASQVKKARLDLDLGDRQVEHKKREPSNLQVRGSVNIIHGG